MSVLSDVADHFLYDILSTDEYEEFFGSCDGGIEQISVAELFKASEDGHYHSFKFAALALMYRYGICKLYL